MILYVYHIPVALHGIICIPYTSRSRDIICIPYTINLFVLLLKSPRPE